MGGLILTMSGINMEENREQPMQQRKSLLHLKFHQVVISLQIKTVIFIRQPKYTDTSKKILLKKVIYFGWLFLTRNYFGILFKKQDIYLEVVTLHLKQIMYHRFHYQMNLILIQFQKQRNLLKILFIIKKMPAMMTLKFQKKNRLHILRYV